MNEALLALASAEAIRFSSAHSAESELKTRLDAVDASEIENEKEMLAVSK